MALALLAHLGFVGLLLFLSFVQVNIPGGPIRRAPPQAVTLRGLSADQFARNRGDGRASPNNTTPMAKRQEPPKPPEKKETTPKGQVVDVAPGNSKESPDAKYLAESSNQTNKESRAKDQTAFYRNAMPRRTTNTPERSDGRDNVEKPQVAGNNGLAEDDRPLRDPKSRRSIFEVPDMKRRQEIAMREKAAQGPGASISNRSESAEVVGNSDRLKVQRGDGSSGAEDPSSGKRGSPGIANLAPSMAVLDKISGAAPNDHLADVEEGEGTFLNTKEWKYSSFFNRVKQGVGMHWDPGSAIRQRDPTLNIYGGRDRYTMLSVTLNDHGRIKNISVEKSCGLDFLDLEAVAAFERAQPFPNPPPGLVSADSTVRFSFGFFLEMGGGPRMRLFRQAN